MLFKTLALAAAFFAPLALAAPSLNKGTSVNVRIEGKHRTIFEGSVLTRGQNVTTISGGSHHCDGTNNGANPTPGPTVTGALDTAAHHYGFTWDGTFSKDFDDFFITTIDRQSQTTTHFWGALLNFQLIQVGGCQQQVEYADEVLWAFGAFKKAHFLKLSGPRTSRVNEVVAFTVTDGSTGNPVAGASVYGRKSDVNGYVFIKFTTPATKKLKAKKADSIRSNSHEIVVTR